MKEEFPGSRMPHSDAASQPDNSRTFFAPPERADPVDIRRLAQELLGSPVAQAVLESFAGIVLILNPERQIVAANGAALAWTEGQDLSTLLGLRPGEAARCVHRHDGPGGCGTGPGCAQCGAVLSILASQTEGVGDTRECLLTMQQGTEELAGEYQVRSTPLALAGEPLTVFVMQDISSNKRREMLESVFFHDVLNLVGGLTGMTHLLHLTPENVDALAGQILDLSSQLTQEILAQRLLMSGERGDLVVNRVPVNAGEVLEDLRRVFAHHEVAEGRVLEVAPAGSMCFTTDPVLLGRVLVNMVKNALEATTPGNTVRVWAEWRAGEPTFVVQNRTLIPRSVANRMFQRSFSTKATHGRGLGTYSMKLFGERYLGGKVGFSSNIQEGTRFWIRLPRPDGTVDVQEAVPPPQWVPQPVPEASPGIVSANSPVPPPVLQPKRGRILVVDDSRTILSVMSKVLGAEHDITTATNGLDALRLAGAEAPDLILLDVVMAGMEGYEVCAKLKADARTADIPVIFLSAMSKESDEAIGLSLGAIDYIHKPISPAIVAARVRNHLELKQARDLLKEMTIQDGLTGIANRRRFEEFFGAEWSRAIRLGEAMSLIMVDIDHFKAYNDGYGHLRGDTCLRSVAQGLGMSVLRPTDLAARYGGEEFVLVLPSTGMNGALHVCRRTQEAIQALNLPHLHSPVATHVTLSMGVVTHVPQQGEDRALLLQAADQLLYQAKTEGRNRFCAREF